MKLKKMIASLAAMAMFCTFSVSAQDEGDYYFGDAYYDSAGTTSLGPELGVGIIVVAAIVAVLINNHSQGNAGHAHVHE